MCIHPKKIATVNRIFTPSEAEVAYAEKVVAAFAEAEATDSAAIQLGGKFIDYPILYRARRVLASIRAKKSSDDENQRARSAASSSSTYAAISLVLTAARCSPILAPRSSRSNRRKATCCASFRRGLLAKAGFFSAPIAASGRSPSI
jgi:hypothetical protein